MMFGGTGKDVYFVGFEIGGDGTGTVKSKVDFTLGDGLENLWLLKGSTADFGIGNALRDMIVGAQNDDLIDVKGGNDNLIGGAGNVVIYGGDGHDKRHGNDGTDELWGGAGSDKLHGSTGNDIA